MAVLYVSEHDDRGDIDSGILPAATLTTQTVTVAASANSSNSFHVAARAVRVHTDTTCFVVFGTAPVATVTSPRMATNETRDYALPTSTNTTFKISVISA